MPDISIPYGTGHVNCFIPENRFAGVLQAKPQPSMTLTWQRQVVREALSHPIGSPCLSDLSRGKQHILIITSDHTRPMPSQITMPLLLEEIRRGNPQAEIHILVATGFHRLTTDKELRDALAQTSCLMKLYWYTMPGTRKACAASARCLPAALYG